MAVEPWVTEKIENIQTMDRPQQQQLAQAVLGQAKNRHIEGLRLNPRVVQRRWMTTISFSCR